MVLISRKSREKREKPGPMNLSHTDLTKRVRRPKGLKAISQIARRFARACRFCRVLSAGWYIRAQAMYAFVRFCVRPKIQRWKKSSRFSRDSRETKNNDGRRFREICEICVSKNKNSIMRKANPMQAINHKEKAKISRNRGCVLKYPWMRDEISTII